MDVYTLLQHCALNLAFKRIHDVKYDRNAAVYMYFSKYIYTVKGGAKGMVKNVTQKRNKAAYKFDQYYGLLTAGELAGPDAMGLDENVRQQMENTNHVAII